MQQIVSQLIFSGDGTVNPQAVSPWLDLSFVPPEANILGMLEAQQHRRVIKTHLPLDALVFSPKAKYIFVSRDARDTMWSLHNHMYHATPEFYALVNGTPNREGPPLRKCCSDPVEYFREFLDDSDNVHVNFWEVTRPWWEARNQPNVLLVHFNDLKSDMGGEIRRVAKFLDIEIDGKSWPVILEHSSFKWMKTNSSTVSPPGAEMFWENGGNTFINKGTNGRWVDLLTPEDNARYEARVRRELGEEGAEWLANGRLAKST